MGERIGHSLEGCLVSLGDGPEYAGYSAHASTGAEGLGGELP
jgi:hypothetical protein